MHCAFDINWILIVCFCLYSAAPGAYCPEKVNLDKGPQYSLTGKGPEPKPDDIPGMSRHGFETR